MSDPKKPFNNPFGNLKSTLGELPAGPPPRAAAVHKGPARAVVRYERKGRGGKEVTVVEQLGLPLDDLIDWLKALKTALGCGGSIEGNALVLQGDQRERVPDLLQARGVRTVKVS